MRWSIFMCKCRSAPEERISDDGVLQLTQALDTGQVRAFCLGIGVDPLTFAIDILTVVTMFALQLISPQAGGDPMQQRLMLVMMPLMFGWFSYRVASGLGLYWVWSSVVGILFQVWLNNSEFGREMRATMAKREARKRG